MQPRDVKREITNIIVPQDTPGFTRSKKYQKDGLARIRHARARICRCASSGRKRARQTRRWFNNFFTVLDGGRISVAALSIGLSLGAYDEALDYAKQRAAFGKPIRKFQAIQFKLVDMLCEIEHAKLMMLKAAWEKDTGRDYVQSASHRKTLRRRTFSPRRKPSRPNPRRLRLHGRIPDLANVPRPKNQRNRRRHQRSPAQSSSPASWDYKPELRLQRDLPLKALLLLRFGRWKMLNIFTSAVRRQRIDSKIAAAFGKKAMRLEVDILLVLIETHKNVHGNRPFGVPSILLTSIRPTKTLGSLA